MMKARIPVLVIVACLIAAESNSCLVRAQDDKEVEKAVRQSFIELESYYASKQKEFEEQQSKQKDILQRARAGQSATDPKVRQENVRAESVIQSAIALTEQALENINAALRRATMVRTTLERQVLAANHARISNISGTVRIKGPDGVVRSAQTFFPILPGDVIETEANSYVVLVTGTGGIFQLGESSSMVLRQPEPQRLGIQPPPPPPERVVEEQPLIEFLKGKLHYFRTKIDNLPCGPGTLPSHCMLKTPIAIAGTRGTEFDMHVSDGGLTTIIPYDGTVELAVNSGKLDRARINRWWEPAWLRSSNSSSGDLPEGRFLPVTFLQGEVTIKRNSTAETVRARAGDTLGIKDSIQTGPSGLVRFDLPGRLSGMLGANSVLQVAKQDSGDVVCALWNGTLHLNAADTNRSTPAGKQPNFITPNAVVNPQTAEVDISVGADQLTTVTPYSGRLTITAQMSKLEKSKFHRWWDEAYQ